MVTMRQALAANFNLDAQLLSDRRIVPGIIAGQRDLIGDRLMVPATVSVDVVHMLPMNRVLKSILLS